MITPNKVISLKESALGRLSVLLKEEGREKDLVSLYRHVARNFESLDQFLLALDTLFILGRIEVDPQTRIVTYAD